MMPVAGAVARALLLASAARLAAPNHAVDPTFVVPVPPSLATTGGAIVASASPPKPAFFAALVLLSPEARGGERLVCGAAIVDEAHVVSHAQCVEGVDLENLVLVVGAGGEYGYPPSPSPNLPHFNPNNNRPPTTPHTNEGKGYGTCGVAAAPSATRSHACTSSTIPRRTRTATRARKSSCSH